MSVPTNASIECSCHGTSQRRSLVVLCPICVQAALRLHLEKREKALRERNRAKQECAACIPAYSRSQRLSEAAHESNRLRDRLSALREECGSLAVKVAAQVVENDERRSQHEGRMVPIQQLERLNRCLYDPQTGAMAQAIDSVTDQVRKLRFQWSVQVFSLYRLDVDKEEKRPTMRHRHARGVGRIAGLPLPHAGPELYGVLPANGLQSALRLVASLTSTVARCLGIVLPHPVMLQPLGPKGDITEYSIQPSNQDQKQAQEKNKAPLPIPPILSSSSASLMSIVESTTSAWSRTAKKAIARATGQQQELLKDTLQTAIPPSMDTSAVSQRLRHATSAVLAEDQTPSSFLYALSHDDEDEDQLAVGLQLLQNDVVALCIRAGVPVANLWPAEALLLNLNALYLYSQEQVAALSHVI